MATIRAKMVGGAEKIVADVKTVADVRAHLKAGADQDATAKGEPVGDDYELIDGDYVVFAGRVMGG